MVDFALLWNNFLNKVFPFCYCLHVKCRIHKVNIFLIQLFPQKLNCFAKALEMNDFPFPEELNHIIHIRIIRKPQNIVIGCSCLLFWERIA